MKLPLEILELDEVESTQDVAANLIQAGDRSYSAVFAHDQTKGKGRLGRSWESRRGQSLTMTLVFWEYPNWPKPWLLGMAVSLAAAQLLDCNVRWPNDLTYGPLKTGGLLSEIHTDSAGNRIPMVGIGINLLQSSFPSDLPNAVSVMQHTGQVLDPSALAFALINKIGQMPEPNDWSDLQAMWVARDATPGKRYKLADGREAVAMGVVDDGALLAEVDGKETVVMAAEALFGV